MPKLSIIIPVYNTSEYLSECLDSVLNQSFDDIEVICIDDGSTDNSHDILKDYASRHDCLKVITQENQGLSSARNTGLNNSTGDYILFLDSDDFLCSDSLEKLYDLAKAESLDLILFKLINFDDETREKSHYAYFELEVLKDLVGENVFNYKDIKEKFFRIPVTSPGKLYKRGLIEDMRFPEGLIFEDNPFFIELIFKVKRAKVLDEYLYMRRLRQDSITNSYYSKFSDSVEIFNIIEGIIKKYGKYEDLKGQLFHRRCRDIFLRFSQVPDELKADFFNIIKKDFSSKYDGLKEDGTFEIASKRSLEIFNSAILCENYHEFELSVEVFDLKKKISKLKKKNKRYKKEIDSLKNSKSKKSFKNILGFR